MIPLQYIKGIGPKKAALFARLGLGSLEDMLMYFPKRWEDRRIQCEKNDLPELTRTGIVYGTVKSSRIMFTKSSLRIFKVTVTTENGKDSEVLFFKRFSPRFDVFANLKKDIKAGKKYIFSGTFDDPLFAMNLRADEYYSAEDLFAREVHIDRIIPVYPLTEGLPAKTMRETVRKAVAETVEYAGDFLPERLLLKRKLFSRGMAIKSIHFPKNVFELREAEKRFIYEELLLLTLAWAIKRRQSRNINKNYDYIVHKHLLSPFRNNLGFEFTASQKKAINEIFEDMKNPYPMTRLLEGDVGSGKTVVALSAMLLAAENKYQSLLAVPTEILAEQHYFTFKKFLRGLPVNVDLLTGKTPALKKKAALSRLQKGDTDILIGTQAVINEAVNFKALKLIVVDEQHRFGVRQRSALRAKGDKADMLIMTATPIPRTLFLALYGDLDQSALKELPPGRKPVKTFETTEALSLSSAMEEVKKGNQVYIVYPVIEETENADLQSVKDKYESIKEFFRGYNVLMLHGRMRSEDKNAAMDDFSSGKADVLVCTQVIEIGIDVPGATLMIINNAERFGLASLHQLRGRVGRGTQESKCLLVCNSRTKDSEERIKAMTRISNGFELSEKDIYLRGAGEIFGMRQHGDMGLRIADMSRDKDILEMAMEDKNELLSIDPELIIKENAGIRKNLIEKYARDWQIIDLT